MFDRGNEIQRIKENMNNVEDKVFANFCEQIGVANIRQYEERELRYYKCITSWLLNLSCIRQCGFSKLKCVEDGFYTGCGKLTSFFIWVYSYKKGS
jgi:hypothetical protein